ncbi:unnamed protein product [Prunus brigantina]
MPRHAETARAAYHDRVDERPPRAYQTARALAAAAIRIGQRPEPIGGPACDRSTSDRGASPAPIRFPPDNFKHSLTLFSKSFSSFPRGTCLLSVSRPCLALDRIYRPIGAAFPNNPTRRRRLVVRQGPGTTGLSPSGATFQWTWARSAAEDGFSGLQFGRHGRPILKRGYSRRAGAQQFFRALDARRPHTTGNRGFATTDCRGVRRRGLGIYANRAARRTGRPSSAPRNPEGVDGGGQRRVTPRQACPRPNGFGRNLRSKTRWFTGFCNSHQVSHFATFFIDARAEDIRCRESF